MAYISFRVMKFSDIYHNFCKIMILSEYDRTLVQIINHLDIYIYIYIYVYINAVCRITPLGFLKKRTL